MINKVYMYVDATSNLFSFNGRSPDSFEINIGINYSGYYSRYYSIHCNNILGNKIGCSFYGFMCDLHRFVKSTGK